MIAAIKKAAPKGGLFVYLLESKTQTPKRHLHYE